MSQASKVIKEAAAFQIPGARIQNQLVKLVSPASFSTLGIDGVCNLVLPNGDAFKVPAGHIVRSAIIRASTDVAGNSLDLGLNATSATTDTTLLDGATVAQVNLGLYCGQVLATATPIIASASDRYVVATAKVAANTAGAIEVVLDIVKIDF